MYAVIQTGGKQYRVSEGDFVFVEKLEAAENETVNFDQVILLADDNNNVTVGNPTVAGAVVTAKVIKTAKGKKVTVFTYKPKKNEKRKMGHRQFYTKVQIESIKA
ncbi:MAG: 50S ribosomal protein L21 [Oscillospiraceae bacterium]|nr:50S ribosomal protein L21 [Oscillospiraceae bacterium]MBQ8732419.1 50S ribosomal protein L21 [Oscillospiraceae bacterium]